MTPQDVTTRMCQLVEKVNREHYGFTIPTDCFCKQGGFWHEGEHTGRWQFDEQALAFIEEAVAARIAAERPVRYARRMWRAVREARA